MLVIYSSRGLTGNRASPREFFAQSLCTESLHGVFTQSKEDRQDGEGRDGCEVNL